MKQSYEHTLKMLNDVYDECQKNGEVYDLGFYARTCGVNPNIGACLVRTQIMKKTGKAAGSRYTWNVRKPDQTMVIEVMDDMKAYNKQHSKKTVKLESKSESNSVNSASISDNTSKMALDDVLQAFEYVSEINPGLSFAKKKALSVKLVEWKRK